MRNLTIFAYILWAEFPMPRNKETFFGFVQKQKQSCNS